MNDQREERSVTAESKPTPWGEELFSVDTRSLAVLRIGVALMVILDVARRLAWTDLFHSDYGVLTANQASQFLGPGYWSLYWLNGSPWFAYLLFSLTLISAVGLMVGYRTRWMTSACLVLVWSLQTSNPLLLTAGHILLRMLLFWMVFLPVSAVWSVDAMNGRQRPFSGRVLSVASAAILLQVAYMYFFSGLAKLNPYWTGGSAMQYAMNFEMYVKPAGRWLAQYPECLQLLTLMTLAAEILGPVLLFLPRCSQFFRGFFMGFFWLLHLCIWLTMSIGLFSVIAMLAWVVFVPAKIWDLLGVQRKAKPGAVLPVETRGSRGLANGIASVFLVYVTVQNILFLSPETSTVNSQLTSRVQLANHWAEKFGRLTMTIQQFRMFDVPPLYNPWYEYAATLMDGQQVELFGGQLDRLGQRPASTYAAMQNQYWRRLHWNLTTLPDQPPEKLSVYQQIRQQLLLKIVQRWDVQNPDNPVVQAQLKCYLEPIQLPGEAPAEAASSTAIWANYQRQPEDSS